MFNQHLQKNQIKLFVIKERIVKLMLRLTAVFSIVFLLLSVMLLANLFIPIANPSVYCLGWWATLKRKFLFATTLCNYLYPPGGNGIPAHYYQWDRHC